MKQLRSGTMTALVLAILVGLAGAYTVRQYLHRPAPAVASTAPIIVPTAAYDLNPGRTLTFNDIVVQEMTPEEFRASPYAGKSFMRNTQQINGRTLNQPVRKGEVFQTASFYPDGLGPGLAGMLQPGQLAITIPVENIGLVSGFVRPGSVVDVLFRSEAPRTQNQKPAAGEITMTLLERISVLAVGNAALPDQKVDKADGEIETATLAVTPYQAKALRAIEGRGQLTLALRSPEETASTFAINQSERITLDQILGRPVTSRSAAIDIYRGGAKTTVEFEDQGTIDQRLVIGTPIAADGPPRINSDDLTQPN